MHTAGAVNSVQPPTPEDTTRLSKVVAALVPCSRSQAEQYITEGWVRVDGRVVEEPQFRIGRQQVEIDPQARLQSRTAASFLVHKEAGVPLAQLQGLLDAANRWNGDESGMRRIKSHSVGLTVLMPLPSPASGLCVLSQDGRIVRKLQEDARTLEQEFIADVTGSIAPGGLARLCHGLACEGQPLPPARVSWQSEARLRFAVKGIAADQVAWMCREVGLQLQGLKRIRIGRVPMAGLPAGRWRYLAPHERF